MKYITTLFIITITTMLISGCDKIKSFTSSDVSLVKDGVLEMDKSLTVGKAIDNYKYFKKTQWKALKTENGKRMVVVDCSINVDAQPSMKNSGIKSADMKYEFQINQDNTFEVGWCGLSFEKNDGEKHAAPENSNVNICINSLRAIYNNVPNF